MKETVNYCVAGHRFAVTADEEYLNLMDNYEPFLVNSHESCPNTFDLSIGSGILPTYVEVLKQMDGEQTIICGTTSDDSHVFEFQWCDTMVGFLVCSSDYRVGQLIPSGKYRKLAIDNALMIMYALATAVENTLLFHAATVSLYGSGYMFLGPSGTGKSTHARLWVEHIKGAELVNDDNPVVRIGDHGAPMVYGSPWSGKTPCYRNVGYPLEGIVLLSQAPCNNICPLSGLQAYAAIMQAISGTRWNRRIADGLHTTESLLVRSVPVWHMQCLPDMEAALVCESTISIH